jgi:hypothetical protein
MSGKRRNHGGQRDRYGRPKTFLGSPHQCHLCLLPIPVDLIVCESHPLFATIDHIIPISNGGKDVTNNRAPAHKYCNNSKANKSLDLMGWSERLNLITVVAPLLQQAGVTLTRRQLANTRNKIIERFRTKKYDALTDIIRWEDEGGAVYVKPFWRK